MNIYLIGIIISLIVYIIVGNYAGKKVKNVNDYYVMGRNAPLILITGTLMASMLGTAGFMGDPGYIYDGYFAPMMLLEVVILTGYVFGAVFLGRFIRRSNSLTVPHYFGKRFNSKNLQKISAIMLVIGVLGYLLGVTQGVSLLMSNITGLSYGMCAILTWIVYVSFCVYSGSRGVVITDTIMCIILLIGSILWIPYVINAVGGWFPGVEALANFVDKPGIFSATGSYGEGFDFVNSKAGLTWGFTLGLAWALAVSSSPWQVSRYMMAKNEHVVMRAGVCGSLVYFIGQAIAIFMMVPFIVLINPSISPSENVLIWVAMNVVPKIVGVIVLTGIMAAGLSSASTFLSLISFSITNDVMGMENIPENQSKMLLISRIVMLLAGVIILPVILTQPVAILYITYFSSTIFACTWGPIALMSVWSKKITAPAAIWGMITGFATNCIVKFAPTFGASLRLPWWLDAFAVGLITTIVVTVVVMRFTEVTEKEKWFREKLLIVPPSERDPVEMKKTLRFGWGLIIVGVLYTIFMVAFWALPYNAALSVVGM